SDVLPPVIIAGPIVTNVTSTSATVVWETDEAATSAISYNDGTEYFTINDDRLHVSHVIHLSGLQADTLYNFSVSSTDLHGNGPVVSTPGEFVTQSLGDTQAPIIIDGPYVINITHQSAVIRWQTDEPADSTIVYGVSPEALVNEQAQASLRSNHNFPLVGLEANTEYFFRVASTDSAGNQSVASEIHSFTTEQTGSIQQAAFTSTPQLAYLSDDMATIIWDTDVPTDSLIEFVDLEGNTIRKEKAEVTNNHQVTLTNLRKGGEYSVSVSAASSTPVQKAVTTLTFSAMLESDTDSPQLVNGVSITSIDDTSVIVQWQTDELADAQLVYNLQGRELTMAKGNLKKATEHRLRLTNLTPNSEYDFIITATDVSGNATKTDKYTFIPGYEGKVYPQAENDSGSEGGGSLSYLLFLLLYSSLFKMTTRALFRFH
ncbi:fibronectin type III domain-containing protein, partial [Kaarinaea lacus]